MPTAMPMPPLTSRLGNLAGRHHRLGACRVVVFLEVDGVELEVVEQLGGGRGEAGLGVTHGGGRVAVDRAEVALRVDQRAAHLPLLAHAHEGGVDDGLAVGVVVAGGVAGDLGALAVLAAGAEVQVVHRHEDAALAGLEAVADIGQGPVHDGAHRVGEVAVGQLAIDGHVNNVADRDDGGIRGVGCGGVFVVFGLLGRVVCHVGGPASSGVSEAEIVPKKRDIRDSRGGGVGPGMDG